MDKLFINHLRTVHNGELMPYGEIAQFIEISGTGNYVKSAYFSELWYHLWSVEKIKRTFSFGHGTIADFKAYAERNRKFVTIINLVTGEIL